MKILIVGGGFAGLKLARALSNKRGIEVLLIDRFNYHQFQPLFYQVATAALDASNISFPLRKVFQGSRNIRFRLAELQQIHSGRNAITTDIGEFSYDVLVIATGADTNWFGNNKLKEAAFPMKSTVEALQLRHRLIENFEQAVITTDAREREALMTIVVVGGGPTGVEVSGALAELRNHTLCKDYPELDFSQMKIYLLEGAGKTLAVMSEKSSRQSQEYLQRLRVDVKLNSIVKDYDRENVVLQDGTVIRSRTVIWAAGVTGNLPKGIDPSLVVRGNRIKVDRFNKVAGTQNIYAIGDIAYMETPLYPKGHPQLANVAINQGKNLAENLIRLSRHEGTWKEFEYKDKGSMATVGRHLAVVDIPKPKWHFGGFLAWMVWMGLHLLLILGVKNRIQIFINWVYNYFTWDQSLRLLIRNSYRPLSKEKPAGNLAEPATDQPRLPQAGQDGGVQDDRPQIPGGRASGHPGIGQGTAENKTSRH
ncbi:MAG TPA: NAD(P)/FAD-dependent oxidoreductase [Chitinophagaceae bacterium]